MNKQKDASYQKLIHTHTPHSRLLRGCLRAFWVGGVICCIGQALNQFGGDVLGLTVEQQPMFTSCVLVFLGTTLTGIGIYDVIGKYAGAGSIVPITGFANSVVSPAMEFRREGLVMGVGAKLFTLAGPVLVYGICSSILVGLIAFVMEVI